MTLRVTQTMMNTQLLSNITNNLSRMNKLQDQMSTGRRINAPSDDPVGLTFAMHYRSELGANDQYVRNVDAAVSQLDYMDMTMGQATDVVQRVRELMVQGSNGALPQSAYDSVRLELSSLYNQLVEIGNSKFNGKYVYNGEKTDVPPYPTLTLEDPSTDPKAYQVASDNGRINFELSAGVVMPVNMTGNELFGDPITADPDTTSDNVFQVIRRAVDALKVGDASEVSTLIGKLDTRLNTMLEKRAEVGARINRVDLIKSRLEDIGINLQNIDSKTEDADMAQVITNLKMEENVYQASLSTGAQLIRPSLVDFLK